VTKFAPHKAVKSIAGGKFTFDERFVVHRVGCRTIPKLTCWVRRTNMSTLAWERRHRCMLDLSGGQWERERNISCVICESPLSKALYRKPSIGRIAFSRFVPRKGSVFGRSDRGEQHPKALNQKPTTGKIAFVAVCTKGGVGFRAF
jgi:hypothetical protein